MNRVHFHNIADEAGVSVRTLYRVMNNQGAVSSATRRKVVTALNRYGYLCSGQKESQTILFDIIRSSFIERVGILLMQRLSLRDFRCVLSNHTEQKERFLDAVSQAAVVVMCSFPTETLLQEVRAANPDCTIVNILGGVGGDVAIDSDDYQGGQLAARHLFANGHRHVGVFSCHVRFGVDIHEPCQTEQTCWKHPGFDIPLRSLIPLKIENLMTAGRCISGSFSAHAAYRVTGDCLKMGEGAGAAATAAIRSGRSIRSYAKMLREK